ncbi:protein kinase superfamily protein [Tasmannia lanceolata]|uniref:protein kinase superfamily protein n=1 Tax=Tasmannia lanceolata TaxID=3420 RepID=UPI0040638661
MESKTAKIAAVLTVICLIILVIVLRLYLGLSKKFFLIAATDFAVILSIFTWVFIQFSINRRKRRLLENRLALEGQQLRLEYSFLRKVAGLPSKFSFEELEAATDNFQALLGRGASGSVFKGILNDGTSIAVKRIEGAEHGEREFQSEVAAIASVQHTNLMRLLGYCIVPSGPRFLVYEFIQNGSLDAWIFQRERIQNHRENCLSWSLRFRIAIEVAKALAYLHHDCRSRILHLDIKPENILLDENFRPLVSDFGLSKLMGKDESRVVTTIRGTRGYLAPEWILENGISEKSDIYSYGMVLLELVGGRRNVCLTGDNDTSQRKWSYFPRIVDEKLREGKIMEVVDKRLLMGGGIEEREVRVLVHVALWCIQEKARIRPSMKHVVDMLEGRVVVDPPPQTEMIIVDLLSMDNSSVGVARTSSTPHLLESQIPIASTYSFTMSVLSGR